MILFIQDLYDVEPHITGFSLVVVVLFKTVGSFIWVAGFWAVVGWLWPWLNILNVRFPSWAHLHQWGSWKVAQVVKCWHFEETPDPDFTKIIQTRKCTTCGKMQKKTLRLE